MMKNDVSITDVVIVGGGVIGCVVAYYLRKVGLDVTILERDEIGQQASSAAAGLLAPLGPLSGPGPFADLLLTSCASFPALVPELEAASDLRVGYERTGALRVVRDPKRIARLRKRFASWQPLGLSVTWLDSDEIHRLEPALAEEVCGAVYAPEESQIDAIRLTQAFAQADRNLGVQMYEQTNVVGLSTDGARVTAVQIASGKSFSCSYVVLATGAWMAQAGTWLNYMVPVRPVRGQMLALRMEKPILRHIIFGDATYLFSRGDTILVGATKEEAGFVAQTTEEGLQSLRAIAYRLCPALGECTMQRAWAGLRPGTPDSRPVVGPLPGWDNVLLAAGHNSLGIALSPITGQTIAETIISGRVPEMIQPFSIERFAER
jgi:glycine oxidase